jgi:hypothetical protein
MLRLKNTITVGFFTRLIIPVCRILYSPILGTLAEVGAEGEAEEAEVDEVEVEVEVEAVAMLEYQNHGPKNV